MARRSLPAAGQRRAPGQRAPGWSLAGAGAASSCRGCLQVSFVRSWGGAGRAVPVGTWRPWLARGSSPGADEARAGLISMRMEPCGSNSLQISPPSVRIGKHFQTLVSQIDHINTPRRRPLAGGERAARQAGKETGRQACEYTALSLGSLQLFSTRNRWIRLSASDSKDIPRFLGKPASSHSQGFQSCRGTEQIWKGSQRFRPQTQVFLGLLACK